MIMLHALNALLMVGLPIALGLVLAGRSRSGWTLLLVGGATFILSQAGHIPFNLLVLNGTVLPPVAIWPLPVLAVFLGLSAALFEEGARYLAYRFWIKTARSWGEAVLFGAGHGGCEAIILGILSALGVINLWILSGSDLATLDLSPQQIAAVKAQLNAAQNAPWYSAMLGAVERVFAITFHVAAAVLVMQVFRRERIIWLAAAIFWHAFLNATAVYVSHTAGVLWTEIALGVLTLISVAIIYTCARA